MILQTVILDFFFFQCVSLGKINQNKHGKLQAFIFGDHCSNKHVSGGPTPLSEIIWGCGRVKYICSLNCH